MIGVDYGNARIRARMPLLLDAGDYSALVAAGDLDGQLGLLSAGPYGPDVEVAITTHSGLRRLDETVRLRLARELRQVRSFYGGRPGERLDLVLQRWEIRNLISLLRAHTRPTGAAAVASLLVPAGSLDRATLDELAAQSGVRPFLDQLIVWGIPSPTTTRALRRALGVFETTGEPAVLEVAFLGALAERLLGEAAEGTDDSVSRQLALERDATDVLTVVRGWMAERAGEPFPDIGDVLLPGGVPPVLGLSALVAESPPDVAAVLATAVARFGPALDAWAAHADAGRLTEDLEAIIVRSAWSELRSDPLDLGVPVGYLWALESEARNLRLIARMAVHGLDAGEVLERLVVP